MTPATRKKLIIALILITTIAAGIFVTRLILTHQVRAKIEQQIYKLRDAGYVVSYDSIAVDWNNNAVSVYRLSVQNITDSSACGQRHVLSARAVAAEGLSLSTLLFKNQLQFTKVRVDSPRVTLSDKTFTSDSTKRTRRDFAILVDRIEMPALMVEYLDSESCKGGTCHIANSEIWNFKLAFYTDQPVYLNVGSFKGDSITVRIPHEYYTLRIDAITLKPSLGVFELDTLRILPQYSRQQFAGKKGYEIDRFEGTIPYINLTGLKISRKDSVHIEASRMTTQIFLKAFRDKRQPFRSRFKQLPIQALNDLPVGINIASVILNKSYIEYQEHAPGADSAGRVYFDNLYATIRNINNMDRQRKGKTIVVARADLMGEGDIRVRAICPWNTSLNQQVSGTVRNLDLKKMNLMLEPVVQLRVESGHLDKLAFQFASGPLYSRGKVDLTYTGLRLVGFKSEERVEKLLGRKKRKFSLREKSEGKLRIAALKSFLINTFIIRKRLDEETADDKRSGTIEFKRHTDRSVFNYWWKSVLSGVKSAYDIDKIQDSKLTKALRKKDKGEP